MSDRWKQLWAVLTGESEGNATVTPTDDCDVVIVTWPDSAPVYMHWNNISLMWEFGETLDTCLCDVAARDTL